MCICYIMTVLTVDVTVTLQQYAYSCDRSICYITRVHLQL